MRAFWLFNPGALAGEGNCVRGNRTMLIEMAPVYAQYPGLSMLLENLGQFLETVSQSDTTAKYGGKRLLGEGF